MNYTSTIGPEYELELHSDICEQLNITVGDILAFEKIDRTGEIKIKKHHDQNLSDSEIETADNLSRVTKFKAIQNKKG
jgi:hypothetical protein